MSAAPFVDIKNLRRAFDVSKPWLNRVLEGGHLEFLKAVDGVTFDIRKGETFALVGESGSGKTTVARMVVGLLPPSSGEVVIDGISMTNTKQAQARQLLRRRIQMIFQDPLTSLNPLYRIGDQIVETIRTHTNLSETAARKRAIDLLAEVGIPAPDKRIDGYPHQFSGGMRQRVVIALAICAEPELIIADEPTTALDVSVQAQIISLIKRLGRDHGTAVMLVTHDMGVIAETSDRVAVMYSGRIAEIGPVQDVIQNPLHPYAKGLMGAIPTLAGEDKRLVQIPGSMPRLSAIPQGCSFNPRCAFAFDRCRIERPEPIRHGAQAVACHLYDATAKETAA
jgi:peptide/nickel transport system ATP-binding protein